jgi:hypothetical protein
VGGVELNLEDVLDPEYGLQQDEYSLSGVVFGEEGQIEVVGWSGKYGTHKLYILKCNKCSKDSELFGEGYFRSTKGNLVNLISTPCGCGKGVQWSQEQFSVLCGRKAEEIGYKFLGFEGEWKGVYTKIKMSCEKHGEWSSGVVHTLINKAAGCLGCQVAAIREAHIKPDELMVGSFLASKAFHPDTKFWRSGRLTRDGKAVYWHISCPECGEDGESTGGNLQKGQRPCACSKQRQRECYINWIVDDNDEVVAIKFGVARDSKQRIKSQNRQSIYEIHNYQVYVFPSVAACKKAERECKQELECGVVLKRDMKDGHTETTWAYNLDKIVEIYERNEGTLEWQNKTL